PRLRRLGVGAGTVVGIHLDRALELVVSVLAVMKAGGAYVPLDPMYPRDRIEFMLEDSGPRVLLTDARNREGLDVPDRIVVFDDWGGLDAEPAENPTSAATLDDLAYVIYTSGSTGRPKGAMITNGSLSSAFTAYDQAYGLTSDTTSHLQMASFSFDVFTGDLIRSLLSGS